MKINILNFLNIYFTSLSIRRAMNFWIARWVLIEESEKYGTDEYYQRKLRKTVFAGI